MPDKHGVATIGEIWRDPNASLGEKVYAPLILGILKGSNAVQDATGWDPVDEIGGRLVAAQERDAALPPGRRIAKGLAIGTLKGLAGNVAGDVIHKHR
jgi:hypothetical protein